MTTSGSSHLPPGRPGRPAIAPAPGAPPAVGGWTPRRPPGRTLLVVEVLGIALGLAGVYWMITLIMGVGGATSTAMAGALAFVPLVVVLAAVRWVDRWEPEPRSLLLAALLWGAGVSTAVSLVFNELFTFSVLSTTGDDTTASVLGAVVGAPLVEESAKGVGVLLIFLLRRRYFDGPVDGIVYGSVVAAGFAFTENILYFVQYEQALGQVFFARAIQGPFAHVTFTACTGLALGLASRTRSRGSWVWLAPLGWAGAVALHALWNGSAVMAVHESVYWTVQVPLFAVAIALVLALRRAEQRTIARRLGEYARAGWFAPFEVEMLTSMPARRDARAWAARRGAGGAMRDFQRSATSLAFARQRALTGRYDIGARLDEQHLLEQVVSARAGFAARRD